jgi:type IV pilus assembly protein PilA
MIVVAIVAILAAVALPRYKGYTNRAKFTEVVAAVGPAKSAVETCILTYRGDVSVISTNCAKAGLKAVDNNHKPAKVAGVNVEAASGTGKISITASGAASAFEDYSGNDLVYIFATSGAITATQPVEWNDNDSADKCIAASLC